MTPAELYQQLLTLKLPVAYSHFPADDTDNPPPKPPYIVYLYVNSSDIMADNQNYLDIGNYQVELYSKSKDTVNEGKVEALFDSLSLPYRKSETRLDSEKLRQVVYEIQLIGG